MSNDLHAQVPQRDRPAVLVVGASAELRGEIERALSDECELSWSDSPETAGDEALRPYDVCFVADAAAAVAARQQLALIHAAWASHESRMPVLALCRDESGAQEWIAAGADDIVFLPLRPLELRARVQGVQRVAHATAELAGARRQRAEQTQTLLALLEISAAGAQDEFGEEALERITSVAAQLAHSQCAALLLPTDDHRNFIVAEAVGPRAAEIRRSLVPRESGLAAEAVMQARPVRARSNGARGAEALHLPWSLPGEYIAVPVQAGQAATGEPYTAVLVVGHTGERDGFSAGQEQSLELVANFAGTSIAGMLSRYWREEARDALVLSLVELAERRDDDTARHLDRVAAFSLLLAEELRNRRRFSEIDDRFLGELRRAAPLHDIGKVAIPDSILLKPGRLTKEELMVMRTHAPIGADAIASVRRRLPSSAFARIAEDIARHHHEWFDGNGYPDQISGSAIPLAARIVTVADVYDALTTRRVYKPALTHDAAMDIIVQSTGTQFDPAVVEAFRRCAEEFRRIAAALSDERTDVDPAARRSMPAYWYLNASSQPLGFLHCAVGVVDSDS